MSTRSLIALGAMSLLTLAGCGSNDDNGTGVTTGQNATVQFINATDTNLDATTNGSVAAGNGSLAFGGSSSCMSLNASNPALGFQQSGTTTALTGFTPNFTAGGNYTVVAYTGADGTTQFATVNNAFTPGTGQGGLAVFNGASGTGPFDVYVSDPGAALPTTASASAVGFGTNSAYFNVTSGTAQQVRLTNAGSQTVALDAGNQTLTGGKNAVLVVGPAVSGSTTLRSFLANGC